MPVRAGMFAVLKTNKVKKHIDPHIILADSLKQIPGIIDDSIKIFCPFQGLYCVLIF